MRHVIELQARAPRIGITRKLRMPRRETRERRLMADLTLLVAQARSGGGPTAWAAARAVGRVDAAGASVRAISRSSPALTPCGESLCGPRSWHLRQSWLCCLIRAELSGAASENRGVSTWQSAQRCADTVCWLVSGPGLDHADRDWPHTASSTRPSDRHTVSQANRPRLARRLRCGWQGGTGQPQVPSGRGPGSQAAPREISRVQTQRSPFFAGRHWPVARHSPFGPGP